VCQGEYFPSVTPPHRARTAQLAETVRSGRIEQNETPVLVSHMTPSMAEVVPPAPDKDTGIQAAPPAVNQPAPQAMPTDNYPIELTATQVLVPHMGTDRGSRSPWLADSDVPVKNKEWVHERWCRGRSLGTQEDLRYDKWGGSLQGCCR
jgi:hypothetical protein